MSTWLNIKVKLNNIVLFLSINYYIQINLFFQYIKQIYLLTQKEIKKFVQYNRENQKGNKFFSVFKLFKYF